MADNYIEKKMESLKTGRTVVRKDNPSLDTLIRRIDWSHEEPASAISGCHPDALHTVKLAQMEAVLRTVGMIGTEFKAELSETGQKMTVGMPGCSVADYEHLGEIIATARLKAAELGLRTDVVFDESKASAEIHFSK